MKYVRNSRFKSQVKKQSTLEKTVEKQLVDDAKWLMVLNDTERFSRDWLDHVLEELLLQAMGKKDILVTDIFGKKKLARMFKSDSAIKILNTIAKMNGHLFDVVKGTIQQQGQIDHNHQHQIELQPDSNRTDSVLHILEQCGALNPVKRLTKDDVEVISSA